MSYSRFKIETLEEKLNLNLKWQPFIQQQLPKFQPSDLILILLKEAMDEALATEKAKSEFIINPIFKELKRHNNNLFSYFSGYKFDVDAKLGLNGYCDFILSASVNTHIIKQPLFCLVEAKKTDLDEGFGQCGAEMVAGKLFNEQHNHPQKIIYGCVTNAFLWAFLKLEDNNLTIDPNYIPLTFTEPHKVLAVLQWIIGQYIHKK